MILTAIAVGIALFVVKYPVETFGWFLLSSVTLDYYYEFSTKLKIGIMVLLLIVLLIKNWGVKNDHIGYLTRQKSLLVCIAILLGFAAIHLPRDLWLKPSFSDQIFSNTARDVNQYYLTAALRHSAAILIVLAGVRLGQFREKLIAGMAIAWLTLLVTVTPLFDISTAIPLLCGSAGGDGFQGSITNRADWSIRFAIATLAVLYGLRKSGKIIATILITSFLVSFFSAGKMGTLLLVFGVCLTLYLCDNVKLISKYTITGLLLISGAAWSSGCYPTIYIHQHYVTQLKNGIMVRLEMYERFRDEITNNVRSGELIPKTSSAEITTPVNKQYMPDQIPTNGRVQYSSPSGSHNMLLDMLTSYGYLFGSILIFIYLKPIIIQAYAAIKLPSGVKSISFSVNFTYILYLLVLIGSMVTIPYPINMLLTTIVALGYIQE